MASVPFSLWGEALWCGQEVVGGRSHAETIRALFDQPLAERGADMDTVAELVPHPENRFDPFAVAVKVDQEIVGYLPQDDAKRYQPVLMSLVGQGLQPQVPCHVRASEWEPADWERRDDPGTDFHASVSIALGQPHLLVPVNLPPAGDYEVLPSGSPVDVPLFTDGPEVLEAYLRPEGECWAHATLDAVDEPYDPAEDSDRRPRQLVEVRLDDEPVGQLDLRQSADFLPAIHYLADLRATTAARVLVRGTRGSAELILYAARTHDLPATWPDGLTRSPVPQAGWHYWQDRTYSGC